MSRRSQDHRFCSSCLIWHRVAGGPCEFCYRIVCPKCGVPNPAANPFICSNCHNVVHYAVAAMAEMTHPEDMTNCNRCGRKLRKGPRDKRRSMGLKY